MHDNELEARLRKALRAEGDDLALRVDVERLEAEMALRRRSRRASRFGLVAAAVAIVAFGIAAVGLNAMPGPNQGVVAPPSATPRPSSAGASPGIPLPVELVAVEGQADATVLLDVPPRWSGPGTRHVVELAAPATAVTTVWVTCIDESVSVDPEGAVTGLGHVTVTTDDGTSDAPCVPDQPFAIVPSLSEDPTAIEIIVPADIAYTARVETMPVPTELPELTLAEAPVEVDGASDIVRPDWSADPALVSTVVGTLDEGFAQEAMVVCLGPGTLELSFRVPGSPPDAVGSGGIQCTGQAESMIVAVGARGPHEVWVEADTRTAWHVIAGSDGALPPFDPPGFRVTAWLGDTDTGGSVAVGFEGCGARFIVPGPDEGGFPCESPAWPDLADQDPLIARPNGELRVRLDEGWLWEDAEVSAARIQDVGPEDAPQNTTPLGGTMRDDVLAMPHTLGVGRWVIRINATVWSGDNGFRAPIYFVVDVQP